MPNTRTGSTTPATAAETRLGLRERKKVRTRQAIREAGYRLIEERGYDNTTIDDIAAAAEVSSSTVFRYFPSKERIILTGDFAAPIIDQLMARPVDEAPLAALRAAVTESMRFVYENFEAEFARRLTLVREVPALRAQVYENQGTLIDALSTALAKRIERQEHDLELRVVVGAVVGALTQALFSWGDSGQTGDLMEMIDRALAVLERGLAP